MTCGIDLVYILRTLGEEREDSEVLNENGTMVLGIKNNIGELVAIVATSGNCIYSSYIPSNQQLSRNEMFVRNYLKKTLAERYRLSTSANILFGFNFSAYREEDIEDVLKISEALYNATLMFCEEVSDQKFRTCVDNLTALMEWYGETIEDKIVNWENGRPSHF